MSPSPLIPRNLAVACLFLLTGRAYVEFPSSSSSGPSRLVHVFRQAHGSGLDFEGAFPVTVVGDQWERAVVPVLQDNRWQISNALTRSRIAQKDFETVIRNLEAALECSYRKAGFIL